MARETLLRPLGLVTQPNDQGQYPPGALSRAQNVHMRNPGLLTTLPVPEVYKADAGGTNQIFRRLFPATASLLAASDNGASTYQLRWITGAGSSTISFADLNGAFSFGVGKVQAIQHRGRYYITSDYGVLAIPSEGATAGTLAGFSPPQSIEVATYTPSPANAIPINKTVAWRAIFTRKGTNGEFVKIGPPSHAMQANNDAPTAFLDFTIRVRWPDNVSYTLQVGDTVELYRTLVQDIGTAVGAAYFLTRTATLTSTALINNYVEILDSTPQSDLGAPLYTNPSETDGDDFGGALLAKYPPGYAVDCANFKGHTFYVTQKVEGYLTVRVPSVWGVLSSSYERTHGIGTRPVTATISSGSAVLTAVSDTTGIVAGQRVDDLHTGTRIPVGTTVLSKTANTITMSQQALSNNVGAIVNVNDVIEVDGFLADARHPYLMLAGFGSANTVGVQFNQPLLVHYNISVVTDDTVNMSGVEMTFTEPWYRYGTPTLRATNGQNYDPPIAEISQTATVGFQDDRLNRLEISELDQPEAIALGAGNELLVGSGEIHRIIATTDALWCWCSDGLWRLSGAFPSWRADPVDPTLVLVSRNAVDLLKGVMWARTNRGLVAVQDGSIEEVSNGVIGDQLAGAAFSDTWNEAVACDDANNEVHAVTINGTTASTAFVFNVLSKAFASTNYVHSGDTYSTAHAYAAYLRAMVWGAVQSASAADIVRAGTNASVAIGNVLVTFQPVTGDSEPFSLKNWIDCTYAFVVHDVGFTILPSFQGQSFPADVVVEILYSGTPKETRGTAGLPADLGQESVAMSPTLAPGFTVSSAGTASAWTFKGLSLRWVPAAEESDSDDGVVT